MTMKFKGQGKINICGFEYKKKILQTAVGGGGGGGVPSTQKKTCIRAWVIGLGSGGHH